MRKFFKTCLGQPELFIKHDASRIDAAGAIVNDDTRKFLQAFVDRYTAWVRAHVPSAA